MKKILAVLFMGALVLFSGCISGSEESHVKDIVRAYYSNYNNRDVDGIISLFSDNFIEDAGGKDKLVENFNNIFEMADETHLQIKIIRFLNVEFYKDTAEVNFDAQVEDNTRDEMSNLTFVLKKFGDKWKIDDVTET
ncbi:MAG: YybH family protein [Candidatus Methanofastidiosia archaeon]